MRATTADYRGLLALVWLTVVGSVVGFVVLPLVQWIRGDGVDITYVGPAGLTELAAHGITPIDDVSAEITVDAGTGGRLLALVPGVLTVVAVVLAAVVITRIVRAIEAGDPFIAANFRRVQLLGGVAMVSAILLPFARGFVDSIVLGSAVPDLTTFRMVWDVNLPLLLGGFVLAIIAEAFARGTQMRDDLEGVI